MKSWATKSLWTLGILCLFSTPSSAQVPVETYQGAQTIDMIMPGTQLGDSIQFVGVLNFTTLIFTPGAVAYEDTLIDFSGSELAFMASDYNIVLKFPDLPSSAADAVGTWEVTGPGVSYHGMLEWSNIQLGPLFSTTSFDVVLFSSFTSLVSEVLWSGPVIPELDGNVVSIDGSHTVTAKNPSTGVINVTASGTIYAKPTIIGVGGLPPLREIVLKQNHPNPFNPRTAIRFSLPKALTVNLSIFDVEGRKIVNLVNGIVGAGPQEFEWDGRDSRGNLVSSGIYIYRLKADNTVLSRKMVLLK